MAKNDLLIKLGLEGLKPTIRGLKRVAGTVGSVGGAVKRFATNWKVLLGAGGVFGLALRESTRFGRGLNEIQTIGKQTDAQLKVLGKSLRDVADDFGMDFATTAKAQYDIISAGVQGSAKQMDVLRTSAKLAVAGVSDIGTTADVLTSALNAYGDELDNVTQVSDTLFKTVELGKTTIPELATSLGQVMPFAKGAGMSIETLGASMATITSMGISTAEATISLKNAIIQLQSPTPRAQKAMETYGVEIKKTDDGMVDFAGTMESFQELVTKNPEKLREVVPNITAQLAIKQLAGNYKTFTDNLDEYNSISGSTDEALDRMTGKFEFQASVLKAQVTNALITVGDKIKESLLPKLTDMNKALEEIGDIGWEFIGQAMADNMSGILKTLLEIAGKGAKIIGLSIGNFIAEGIRDSFPTINSVIDHIKIAFAGVLGMQNQISTMAKLSLKNAGVNETTLEIEKLKMELMALGRDGYSFIITKATDLKKASEGTNDALDKTVPKIQAVATASDETGDVQSDNAETERLDYASSLSMFRNKIKAYLAEAIAGYMAKSFATQGPMAFLTASAGAIAISSLFDELIPKFAKGGQMITQGPQLFLAGDNPSGREMVTVEPLGGAQGAGRNVTVNISAPLVDETVRDSILPAIRKAVIMDLA